MLVSEIRWFDILLKYMKHHQMHYNRNLEQLAFDQLHTDAEIQVSTKTHFSNCCYAKFHTKLKCYVYF